MTMCYEASRSFTLSTSHTCTENHAPNASTTLEALPPMHARVRSHTNTWSAKPFRAPLSQNTQMQKTDKPYTEIEIEKNIYIYIYMYMYMYMQLHTYTYMYIYICILYIYMYMYMYMYTCIHTYICTYIYTLHARICVFFLQCVCLCTSCNTK